LVIRAAMSCATNSDQYAEATMTGSELRHIRNSLDLSRVEFGRALGYRGENVGRVVRRLEAGDRDITEEIAEMATKLLKAWQMRRRWVGPLPTTARRD
jgi:DNA-binding transcriptional regulator YiaG